MIFAPTNPPIKPKIGLTIKLLTKIEMEYNGENPVSRIELPIELIILKTSSFTSCEKGSELRDWEISLNEVRILLFLVMNVTKISKKLPKKAATMPVNKPNIAPLCKSNSSVKFFDRCSNKTAKYAATGTTKQQVKPFKNGTTCRTPAAKPVTRTGKYFFKTNPYSFLRKYF